MTSPLLKRLTRAARPVRSVPEPAPRPPAPRRPPSYYRVAGLSLDHELERLCALPAFARGPLATRVPELKVRRASARPKRLGFAVPAEYRLSVTAYPGIRPGDVLETLLHELTHLHVGRAAEPHGWHGQTFKRTLARAMDEAYGVDLLPANTRHGPYAEAIERARTGATAGGRGEPQGFGEALFK